MTSGETGDPTATDGPETETDGEPGCEPGDAWVSWAEDFVEPVPGVEASFAAVLEGPCSLASVFSGSADGVTFVSEGTITLSDVGAYALTLVGAVSW